MIMFREINEDNRQLLTLYVPKLEELWYREQMMSDPATMSYNSGYELSFEGYHAETGCIDFPREEWDEWYDYFIGKEPERYYAYIVRKSDGAYLGEVNVHRSCDHEWYEMGIVIESKYRGKGYAHEALEHLLEHAFDVMKVNAVHNDFEDIRDAAVRTHLGCGFREYSRRDGHLDLLITREQYMSDRENKQRL